MVKYRHDCSHSSYFRAGDTQETSISGVPENPAFQSFMSQNLVFQEKTRFSVGGGTPIGALQHVHQGNAAATVRAHGLAKMARRTVPYGFSCSSCAPMGRLAPRFSHVPSPQQPRSRPSLLENTTLAVPGKGVQHMSFFRILAHCWVRTLAPRTRATHGLLLDKKYFLLKRQCLREVRAQM